jgi:phosphatidylglycerol lysyltransferase
MRDRLYRTLPPLIGLAVFLAALVVLRRELHSVSWHSLVGDLLAIPVTRLASAVLLTAINYAVLTGYDFIAFEYIGKKLSKGKIFLTSFLAYAIAHNVGFAMLSGASVRYRFYARWGVTPKELSRIVFSYSVTFWLGLLFLGGLSLAISPLPAAHDLPASWLVVSAGWALAAVPVVYLSLTVVRREPVRFGKYELPLPRPRLAAAQLLVSVVDWALAGAVFYVLLPAGTSFLTVLGAFLAAQLLGLASHVPGGVGVFEGLMVILLKPFFTSGQLFPALAVFRAIYYLLPLCLALLGLVIDEIHQRRSEAARAKAFMGRLSEELTPRVLAVVTFIGGLVLLFSGATPAAAGRLGFLAHVLPLSVVETSHFVGSLVGVALLLLSHGIARRLDAAYYLTAAAISVGMLASLLKGADYEEAIVLAVLLIVLYAARGAFDRKTAFFEARFSASWIAAVAAAVTASIWLGLFAFKHVEYSNDLWWQFTLHGEASRFLRAAVGSVIAVTIFAITRLIAYAPHEAPEPTNDDLETATAIIRRQTATYPYLVYLRDKSLLFDEEKTGFVMYAVQGRSWIAMGDPVCPPERIPDMIRLFLEKCDDFGATAAFYEIGKGTLHHYADFGMTFVKLGEEARVDLQQFTIEGSSGSKFRQVIRRLERDGCTFRIVQPENVAGILDQLEAVSNNWRQEKSGGEKGFSLGFFDPQYVVRFPVAVIEREGRIQAFTNIWPGPEKHELSADLMRYHCEAPKNVMEALFVHVMNWGKEQGYQWFGLGMAPMSGFEKSPVAPLWSRLGMLLYEHGGALYNFQGLRAFKQKFNPIWVPHYLAYPGGLTLPRVLADAAALVAGGYRRIFLNPKDARRENTVDRGHPDSRVFAGHAR